MREVEGCQTGFIVSLKSGCGRTDYPSTCTYIVTCFIFKFIYGLRWYSYFQRLREIKNLHDNVSPYVFPPSLASAFPGMLYGCNVPSLSLAEGMRMQGKTLQWFEQQRNLIILSRTIAAYWFLKGAGIGLAPLTPGTLLLKTTTLKAYRFWI